MAAGLRTVSEWSSSAVEPSSEPVSPSLNGSSEGETNGAGGTARLRDGSHDERFGRLYAELQRPARAMLRRAFGSMFSDAEIEDVYGNAWLGTLRALRNREPQLTDSELRKYVLTAVANHASKELRRRGRRPTTPLEAAREVADVQESPDERVASREQSQVTREILATLPERRRAVLLFRYGWGLKPEEVCGLVKGLSHRAYRKEITRGVDEITDKLRLVEQGRWCADREPVIKAYATGLADPDQQRQAEQHLAYCRPCAEYAVKLNGHLHEIGASIAWTGVADVTDGHLSALDRVGGALDSARDGLVHRGAADSSEVAASQLASSGAGRGAGAAGAGVLTKLAGAGAGSKLIAACLTGGAAATCVAAGVVSGVPLSVADKQVAERPVANPPRETKPKLPDTLPSQIGNDEAPAETPEGEGAPLPPAPAPEPAPATEAPPPPPPPQEQEFGIAPAPASGGGASGDFGVGSGSTGSGADSAPAGEFGP
jgi:RNA polymerase sigma factor (sigma-70 family)